VLGEVYLWKKQHERAIAELEKAIALNPNAADQLAELGNILTWAGRPEEGMGWVQKAMRLNPIFPVWYLWALGHAYFLMNQREEAVEVFKRAINVNPNFLPAHFFSAVIYVEIGHKEAARAEFEEIMRISPETPSLEAWRKRLPYKDQSLLARLLEGLHKAGLK
jgi:adenylate cyclase